MKKVDEAKGVFKVRSKWKEEIFAYTNGKWWYVLCMYVITYYKDKEYRKICFIQKLQITSQI
jgi:hypothetical protein